MTTRDELIEQGARTVYEADPETLRDEDAPVLWEDVERRMSKLTREGYLWPVSVLVDMGWRPPPGGDVIEQTQNELRHRIEDLGLVQEIEGEDGGEIYDGPRVYEEAAAILTRNLAEEGLLAYSKAEVPECEHIVARDQQMGSARELLAEVLADAETVEQP
jgi:hypothetical protein